MPAADRIRRQLERLAHLRGLGPVPNDHARWIDQTRYLLISTFGENSAEADSFLWNEARPSSEGYSAA